MLISVIIPVYKVEKYLHQCLESVIEQDYSDLEIIPVDDGSPDSCGKIIDQFAAQDSRIKPLHQPNGGYGNAVNNGLAAATGDYVAIVESDDWIEPDMFSRLAAEAKRTNYEAEIVKSGFNRIVDQKVKEQCHLEQIIAFCGSVLSPCNGHCDSLYLFESSIWSAIYRRDFLLKHQLKMLETRGAAYQDAVFKFMVYVHCSHMRLLPGAVYNYRVLANGSSSASDQHPEAMFENYDFLEAYLKEHRLADKFARTVAFHKMFDFVFHTRRLTGASRKEFLKRAAAEMREIRRQGIDPNSLLCDKYTEDYYRNTVLPLVARIEGSWRERLRRVNWHCFRREFLSLRWMVTLLKGGLFVVGGLVLMPLGLLYIGVRAVGRRLIKVLERRIVERQNDYMGQLFYDLYTLIKKWNNHYSRKFRKRQIAVFKLQNQDGKALSSRDIVSPTPGIERTFRVFNCGNPLDTERLYRNDPQKFMQQIAEFKRDLDPASVIDLDNYIKRALALPTQLGNFLDFKIPYVVDFFSDNEKIILANQKMITEILYDSYTARFDLKDLDFSLHVFYYQCGLIYLPDAVRAKLHDLAAVDCGAYTGDSTIMFAAQDFKQIFAFEAIPDIYARLVKVVERNNLRKKITCVQAAVGDEEKLVRMSGNGDGSFVSEDEAGIEVPVRRLDQYFAGRYSEVGLLKMDIEGFEEPALRGAEALIRAARPVLLISVYHNWVASGQMFLIKRYLENLNLGYRFKFHCTQPDVNLITEYVLIAYVE